jgi:hypothetical protein
VVDVTEGVTRQYRIETGERRYWATWLLRDFIPGYTGDGMIPCIIIPHDLASPFRQAKENTARTGLSAVAMARQAALLLLTVHGYELPGHAVTNDFYRQALELHLRGKSDEAAEILTAMGGISKMHFSRYKALLKLTDEALELADRYDIDEKKLRYIVALPEAYHTEVVRQIIDFNLTSKQVKELCESDEVHEELEVTEEDTIPKQALRLARIMRSNSKTSGADIARALVRQEEDRELARVHLHLLRRAIDDAEAWLDQN